MTTPTVPATPEKGKKKWLTVAALTVLAVVDTLAGAGVLPTVLRDLAALLGQLAVG